MKIIFILLLLLLFTQVTVQTAPVITNIVVTKTAIGGNLVVDSGKIGKINNVNKTVENETDTTMQIVGPLKGGNLPDTLSAFVGDVGDTVIINYKFDLKQKKLIWRVK